MSPETSLALRASTGLMPQLRARRLARPAATAACHAPSLSALKAMLRILRPGGSLALTVCRNHRCLQLQGLVTRALSVLLGKEGYKFAQLFKQFSFQNHQPKWHRSVTCS